MKKVKVELEGLTPLLMNSPKAMLLDKSDAVRTTKKYDHKVEAEKVAYRTDKGELYVPAEAIKGCLINAASYKKVGKYSLKPIIAGAVRIEPKQIGLGTKVYDIDLRTVVIQHARVVKARPTLKSWKVSFEILYNEELITDHNVIRACLEEGGQRIGLLDFRPQKMGEFGQFIVKKWLPQK